MNLNFKKNIFLLILFLILLFFTLFNRWVYEQKLNKLFDIKNEINFSKKLSGDNTNIYLNDDYDSQLILEDGFKLLKYKYLILKFDKNIKFRQIPIFINYETQGNVQNIFNFPISSEIFMTSNQNNEYNHIIIRVVSYRVENESIIFKNFILPSVYSDYLLSISDVTKNFKKLKIFPLSYYYKKNQPFFSRYLASIKDLLFINNFKNKINIEFNSNFIIKNKSNISDFYSNNFLTQYHSNIHYNLLYTSNYFDLQKGSQIIFDVSNEFGNLIMDVYLDNNLVERQTTRKTYKKFVFVPIINGKYKFKFISELDKYNFSEINFSINDIKY